MHITSGVEWLVCAPSGATVCGFNTATGCARWLREHKDNGVPYTVKCVERHVYDVAVGMEQDWAAITIGEFAVPPPCPQLSAPVGLGVNAQGHLLT